MILSEALASNSEILRAGGSLVKQVKIRPAGIVSVSKASAFRIFNKIKPQTLRQTHCFVEYLNNACIWRHFYF